MSNLIKSGRVIDIGVPVNVGGTYAFSSNQISSVEKVAVSKFLTPVEETEGKIEERPSTQGALKKEISEEEITNMYIEEAKKRAEDHYQQEMQKAYEEGLVKAREEAASIIENAKSERENMLSDIVKLKEDILLEYKEEIKNAEKDLLDISLDIVEKIINYEVDRSDNYVLGIVKDSLDRVLNKKDVVLKLSTADYYTVLSNKKHLVANVKGFGEIEIVQDESMETGTCIVDTPLGVIDGSIQVRMDNIQKEVMKMLAEG